MKRNFWKIVILAMLAVMCASCGQVKTGVAKTVITNYMTNSKTYSNDFKINKIKIDSAFTKSIPTFKKEFVGWGCAVNYSYTDKLGIPMTTNGYFVLDKSCTKVLNANKNVGIEKFTDIAKRLDEFNNKNN